jgi:hypothetical protein
MMIMMMMMMMIKITLLEGASHREDIWESGGTAPRILKLGNTIWR